MSDAPDYAMKNTKGVSMANMSSIPTNKLATMLAAALFAAGWLVSGTVVAQDQEIKSLRGKPSKEQIIEALTPANSSRAQTRGLSLGNGDGGKLAATPWTRTLDLEVKFQFNSDQLSSDGLEVVDRLGAALQSPALASIKAVTLEGHADATGEAAYNMALSLRRAQSVKASLAGKEGIPRVDIKVVGKGITEPVDPAHPTDPINRRVRVIVSG
jgi:outer membrane protein OmpA-like peptidoglycan-associated protein